MAQKLTRSQFNALIDKLTSDLFALGKIDYDRTYGYQCVDVAKELLYRLGLQPGTWGDAIAYWEHTNGNIMTICDRIPTTDVIKGDIVIKHPNHIGYATGQTTDDSIEIVEQNGSTGGGSGEGKDAIRTRFIKKNTVAGVLRYKVAADAPVVAPAPAAAPVQPFSVSNENERIVRLKVSTNLWDLNRTTWDDIGKNPLGSYEAGTLHRVDRRAHHTLGGDYLMPVGHASSGFNVVDCEDYTPPAEAPAPVEQPVAVAPAPVPSDYTYSKLATPLDLETAIDATKWWNLGFKSYPDAQPVTIFPKGTPFKAYGKAQRNDLDHPCYYMTEQDFGQADVTGVPVNNHGINTVDLRMPEPIAMMIPPTPETPVVVPPTEELVVPLPTPEPLATPADEESITVPVKVVPPAPIEPVVQAAPAELFPFKKYLNPREYVALTRIDIYDYETNEVVTFLRKGIVYTIAGEFTVGKEDMLRTVRITSENKWIGIPKKFMKPIGKNDDDIFALGDEISTIKTAAIKAAGKSAGLGLLIKYVLTFKWLRKNK